MRSNYCLVLLFVCFLSNKSFADTYPRNYSIDVLHYRFEVSLNDSNNEIIGKTSITIQFKKSNIKQFRLDLINQTEQRKGKGMLVQSISSNNQVLNYTHVGDSLMIQLAKPSTVDTVITFEIQYKGIPEEGLRIIANKFGDRTFFSENWPNKTRHWLPSIDHPYDKATSEFLVKAPAKYQVVSNGLLLEESVLGNNTKLTHWKQSVPVSCWLFVLGVAEFAVKQVDQFNGKAIQTWVYPQDREAGFADFAEPTKQVLSFYSEYVGPFAYEKLANVQSTVSGGGMETSSAIYYAEKLITGKKEVRLRNVVIHEIAHQWFGNAVTESTWDDAWLSEGLTTFFTLLFIEQAYGHDEYIAGVKSAKKSVYDYIKKDSLFSIVSNRSAETGAVTSGLTYQKGAWIMHMLRDKIGEVNFRNGIQAYYKKYFNANATTIDFIAEMEKASNQNLQPFFNQWLYKPDNLKLSWTWDYDAASKQILIHVQQHQSSGFVFDVPVEFEIMKDGIAERQIVKQKLNTKTADFKIPSATKPAFVSLDPRTVLLYDLVN
jgi:aminopeptidase N